MDQLPRYQAGDLGQHVHQGGVLHHVPAVGGEHILAALVQDGVEGPARDIEGHGIGAGVQGHLVQVVVVVEIGQDTPGGRVMLQVVEHPVHLVELPLGVAVLHPQLVAVGLSDTAAPVGPGVPDVAVQIMDIVGFFLPDPQKLVHRAFERHAADGLDRELLPQVVAVDDAEALHGMGGGAILPPGAHLQIGIPNAVAQDLLAVLDEQLVCAAHVHSSRVSLIGSSHGITRHTPAGSPAGVLPRIHRGYHNTKNCNWVGVVIG